MIDYLLVSDTLLPCFTVQSTEDVPWGPHKALHIKAEIIPENFLVKQQQKATPLTKCQHITTAGHTHDPQDAEPNDSTDRPPTKNIAPELTPKTDSDWHQASTQTHHTNIFGVEETDATHAALKQYATDLQFNNEATELGLQYLRWSETVTALYTDPTDTGEPKIMRGDIPTMGWVEQFKPTKRRLEGQPTSGGALTVWYSDAPSGH